MARTWLWTVSATTLVLVSAATACSSSGSNLTIGPDSASCDAATLMNAMKDAVGAGGARVDAIEGFTCADGWALVRATVSGNGMGAAVSGEYIFETEGSFWIMRVPTDVCGTVATGSTAAPADAQVPTSLWADACAEG